MTKVLVVATSPKTRGGITSVVSAHSKGHQWQDFHCYWLATHRDGNFLIKIGYLAKSLLAGLFLVPYYALTTPRVDPFTKFNITSRSSLCGIVASICATACVVFMPPW